MAGMLDFLRATAVNGRGRKDDPHGNFPSSPAKPSKRSSAGTWASANGPAARSRVPHSTITPRGEGMTFHLRYALAHMVEETARHCGAP
jgi:hypothetical protein